MCSIGEIDVPKRISNLLSESRSVDIRQGAPQFFVYLHQRLKCVLEPLNAAKRNLLLQLCEHLRHFGCHVDGRFGRPEVVIQDSGTELAVRRDPVGDGIQIESREHKKMLEHRSAIITLEPVAFCKRSEKHTHPSKVQGTLLCGSSEGIGDKAHLPDIIEQIGQHSLKRHHGQAFYESDVSGVELAPSISNLCTLRLAAPRRHELVTIGPQVTNTVEPRS